MRIAANACALALGLGGFAAALPVTPFEPPSSDAATQSAAVGFAPMEFSVSPFVDLHFWVRSVAAGDENAARVDLAGFDAAVAAARAVESELRHPMAWNLIDGVVFGCATADEAHAAVERLPEKFRFGDADWVPLRAVAGRWIDALAALEAAHRESAWPQRRAALDAALARAEAKFSPDLQRACLDHVCASLGMSAASDPIAVVLVLDAPAPGAVTLRSKGGLPVCVVSVSAFDGTLLWEAIVHEAVHALDAMRPRERTALAELRLRLRQLNASEEILRDVPHTLIFVQAGETVRRVVDLGHVPYGEARGYYAKVPMAAKAVVEPWSAHLRGEIDRAAAIERIVAALPLEPNAEAVPGAPATRPGGG